MAGAPTNANAVGPKPATAAAEAPRTRGVRGDDSCPPEFSGTCYPVWFGTNRKPLDRSNPTEVYDIHATILHLLGLDHEKLTHYHNGIQRRLTDVHGKVIKPLLA